MVLNLWDAFNNNNNNNKEKRDVRNITNFSI